MTKIVNVLLAVSLLLTLATLGYSSAIAAPAVKTVCIGVSAPLSGGGALMGRDMVYGARMAAEDINGRGGITIGGEKYLIKIASADDKYTSEGGVSAANYLILERGAQFIVGPLSTAAFLAAYPTYEKNKALVQHLASAPEATAPDKPLCFRAFIGGMAGEGAVYHWLKETNYWPGVKTLAIINPDDATGWEATKYAKVAAQANGFDIVGEEYYPRGLMDFGPLISRVMKKNTDMISFGWSVLGETALMLKELYVQGYEGKIIALMAAPVKAAVALASKEAAEGVLTGDYDPQSPLVPPRLGEFYPKYEAKYKMPPLIGTYTYDAVQSFALAIEKAGTLDTAKVAEALEALEWESLFGPAHWGGEEVFGIKRQLITSICISEVRDGKPVVLAFVEAKLYAPPK